MIKGTILLTLIKWNLPVDYLNFTALIVTCIRQGNK